MVVLGRPSLGCVTRAVAAVEGQCTERTAGRTMAESGCLDLDRIEVKQLLCSHSHCTSAAMQVKSATPEPGYDVVTFINGSNLQPGSPHCVALPAILVQDMEQFSSYLPLVRTRTLSLQKC